MIVGNGMLAKAFISYVNNHNIVIFASGVSNSKEMKSSSFEREATLLSNTISKNKDKIFVYFSTCSIEDNSQRESIYIKHKIKMEKFIQNECQQYYIFRLPQVVGKTNSPTLINFLVHAIKNENPFIVQKYATRNLIDVNDIVSICSKIISKKIFMNEITNIASPFNTSVIDIVHIIEDILQLNAKYSFIDYGEKQDICIDKIKSTSYHIFTEDYYKDILVKVIFDDKNGFGLK